MNAALDNEGGIRAFPGAAQPIHFYLPFARDGVRKIPERSSDYWSWISKNRGIGDGKYVWTLQTYLQLSEAGFPCRLVQSFPRSGIVVSHRDFLPIFLLPRPGVFLVCIKPDRKAHTWAQFHIVQNERDPICGSASAAGRTAMIPHWPQPSLIPRRAERKERVQNVAYVGRTLNLAEELKAERWKPELAQLGFDWSTVDFERWNDYSEIDVTVSVRSFGAAAQPFDPIHNPDSKPSVKLINSWLAGVPAIVGAESAYQSMRASPLDCIEVRTPAELREALLELKGNPTLYRDMVAHGLRRARDYSAPAVSEKWIEVFQTEIERSHSAWLRQSRLGRVWDSTAGIIAYLTTLQNLKDLRTIFKK